MAHMIFVLPGFGGSELWLPIPYQKVLDRVLWFNEANLLAFGPESLTLAPNGLDPIGLLPRLKVGPVMWKYYGDVYRELASQGYTVRLIPFDWRTSLIRAADSVAAEMSKAVEDGVRAGGAEFPQSIRVIGHSLGGLVAGIAYNRVSRFAKEIWKRTVYLGTPHGGTFEAAAGLDQRGRWWRMVLDDAALLIGLAAWESFRTVSIQAMVRSWPSVYEMMPPSWTGATTPPDPALDLLYQASNYYIPTAGMQGWMDAAKVTQQQLRNYRDLPRPEELCVVGTGLETLNRVSYSRERPVPPHPLVFWTGFDGDTVLPDSRGRLTGVRTVLLPGQEHLGLIQDQRVLSRLRDWLFSPLTEIPDQEQVPVVLKKQIPFLDVPPAPQIIGFFPAPTLSGADSSPRRGDP